MTDHVKINSRDTSSHELELSFRVPPCCVPRQFAYRSEDLHSASTTPSEVSFPSTFFQWVRATYTQKVPPFWLRCVPRLSQPFNALIPARTYRACFISNPSLGFSLRGFSPSPGTVRSFKRRILHDVTASSSPSRFMHPMKSHLRPERLTRRLRQIPPWDSPFRV